MRRSAKLQIKLTTTGARTGEPRLVTLYAWPDGDPALVGPDGGDRLILVGSSGGAVRHPAWVHNLRAEPVAIVKRELQTDEMMAREVTDAAERDRLWELVVDRFPQYATYQRRTARLIPIFILTRNA